MQTEEASSGNVISRFMLESNYNLSCTYTCYVLKLNIQSLYPIKKPTEFANCFGENIYEVLKV